MTDERSQPEADPRDELERIANSFAAMKRLLAEKDELLVRADSFERQAVLAMNENEMLRKQVKAAKRERDHYFRAHSALSAQLETMGGAFLHAVKTARAHSYENGDGAYAPPAVRVPRAAPRGASDLPSFLRNGPQRDNDTPERTMSIDLASLARAITMKT